VNIVTSRAMLGVKIGPGISFNPEQLPSCCDCLNVVLACSVTVYKL